jgi:membrane protein implicated in regulation of membrane protease activity
VIVFWHWLVVAAVFAVIEVAVPAMVCIWFAIAALGTAAIAWLAPDLAWEHQALTFATLAIASVAIGRIVFARIRARPSGSRLNRRAEGYIGRTFTLERPIVDGRGRLRVNDTMWLVEGPDLPAGTRVQVTSVNNTLLRVTQL